MKRFVCIICLVMVLSMIVAIPAYASEQSQRASNFFSSFKAYCYESSSSQLAVYFRVVATGTMNKLGASVIKVQRSSDGDDWETVNTFTKESYPQMICENTGMHATTLYCAKTPGYYYRAYVTFYAKNSTGTGIYYYYTAEI